MKTISHVMQSLIYTHNHWNYLKFIYVLHFNSTNIFIPSKNDLDFDYYRYLQMIDKEYFRILNNSPRILKNEYNKHIHFTWKSFINQCFLIKKRNHTNLYITLVSWEKYKNFKSIKNDMIAYQNYRIALNVMAKTINQEEEKDEDDKRSSNMFLYSYDKNIMRITYIFLKNRLFYIHITEYLRLLIERLDSETRNIYYSKFKDWMNFHMFIKPPKGWNKLKIQTSQLVNSNTLVNHQNITELSSSMMRPISRPIIFENRSIQYLKKIIEEEKEKQKQKKEEENKLRLAPLSFYIPIFYLIQKIEKILTFSDSGRLCKRNYLDLKESNSIYYQCFEDQFYCDVVSVLKVIQTTEFWINHIFEVEEKITSNTKNCIKSLRNYVVSTEFNRELQFKYTYKHQLNQLLHEIYLFPSENLDLYIRWIQRSTKSFIVESLKMTDHLQTFDSNRSTNLLNFTMTENQNIERMRHIYLDNIFFVMYAKENILNRIQEVMKILRFIKVTISLNHVRLVMSIAKNMNPNYVEIVDLLQEGMLGVLKAVERFELDRGYQFTTYATWWVQQALNKIIAVHGNNMIPLPTHLQRKIHLIQTTSRALGQQFRREPLIEEIAAELRIPVYKIYQFLESSSYSKKIISLDQKVSLSDNRTFQYFLQKIEYRVPINITRLFGYLMRFISIKEATILRMKLGITPFQRHNMEQIMRIFGIHRDKIKFIERKSRIDIKYRLSLHGRYNMIAPYISKHLSDQILQD